MKEKSQIFIIFTCTIKIVLTDSSAEILAFAVLSATTAQILFFNFFWRIK